MNSDEKDSLSCDILDCKQARPKYQSPGHDLFCEKTAHIDVELLSPDAEGRLGRQVSFKRCARRNFPLAISGLVLMWFLYSHLQLEQPSPLFASLARVGIPFPSNIERTVP